jgi:predicted naringenin-chalcone synthase
MGDRRAYVNAIAGAVPDHDIHQAYVHWARGQLADRREQSVFDRMAERCGIDHRWSVLPRTPDGGSPVSPGGFYSERVPGTAERMRVYAEEAPALASLRSVGFRTAST